MLERPCRREKCVEYLFRKSRAQRVAVRVYQVAYVAMVFAGCVTNLDVVWEFADCFNGLMAIPNLIALGDPPACGGLLPRPRQPSPARHGLQRDAGV